MWCVCCLCGTDWHAEKKPCVGSKRFRVYRQNACMCSGARLSNTARVTHDMKRLGFSFANGSHCCSDVSLGDATSNPLDHKRKNGRSPVRKSTHTTTLATTVPADTWSLMPHSLTPHMISKVPWSHRIIPRVRDDPADLAGLGVPAEDLDGVPLLESFHGAQAVVTVCP